MGNAVKKALENPAKEESIRKLFEKADKDKSGFLEKAEWMFLAPKIQEVVKGDDSMSPQRFVEWY